MNKFKIGDIVIRTGENHKEHMDMLKGSIWRVQDVSEEITNIYQMLSFGGRFRTKNNMANWYFIASEFEILKSQIVSNPLPLSDTIELIKSIQDGPI
jgi:hypothetical protein